MKGSRGSTIRNAQNRHGWNGRYSGSKRMTTLVASGAAAPVLAWNPESGSHRPRIPSEDGMAPLGAPSNF
jgi:hypothetical protein